MNSLPLPVKIMISLSGSAPTVLKSWPTRAMIFDAQLNGPAVGVGLNQDDAVFAAFQLVMVLEPLLVFVEVGRGDKIGAMTLRCPLSWLFDLPPSDGSVSPSGVSTREAAGAGRLIPSRSKPRR